MMLSPPPGSMSCDGAPVLRLTRAPSGAYYVTRKRASTVLVAAEDLPRRVVCA